MSGNPIAKQLLPYVFQKLTLKTVEAGIFDAGHDDPLVNKSVCFDSVVVNVATDRSRRTISSKHGQSMKCETRRGFLRAGYFDTE